MFDSSESAAGSSVQPFSSAFERTAAERPPDRTELRELVGQIIDRGTGAYAIRSTSGSDSVLLPLWEEALCAGEDTAWHRLPDRALEVLEAQERGASADDLNFLAETLARSPVEAVAATRLLACIGEEGLAPLEVVRALLLDFLAHGHPAVRVSAAEAFWQLADRSVTGDLRLALEREAHPRVRETIEHVLHVFG